MWLSGGDLWPLSQPLPVTHSLSSFPLLRLLGSTTPAPTQLISTPVSPPLQSAAVPHSLRCHLVLYHMMLSAILLPLFLEWCIFDPVYCLHSGWVVSAGVIPFDKWKTHCQWGFRKVIKFSKQAVKVATLTTFKFCHLWTRLCDWPILSLCWYLFVRDLRADLIVLVPSKTTWGKFKVNNWELAPLVST